MENCNPTHILMRFQENVKTQILCRAADGIVIGQCKDETVIFGDEPNKRRSHVFMDHAHALRWLTETWARQDLEDKGLSELRVQIEERIADPVVVMPADSVQFGQMNGPRKFN
jgi:hypothetical protein